MTLGDAIRTIRQKSFLTQEDFANELRVALSTVNRWEQNKVCPNMKAMKAIKDLCDRKALDFKIVEDQWLIAKANNTPEKESVGE